MGYTKLLVTFDRSSGRSSAAAQHKTSVTLTDFEADSESSDLETIQRCMRSGNQRNTNKNHYIPLSYKFLANNGNNLKTGHNKRSAICGSVTTVNLAGFNAAVNNTSELESCEIDDMQTTAAATKAPTITATLLNEHLPHKYKQQQQRVTLMAITQNAMTTGSTTSTKTQSLGSTVATSTTSNNSNSHSNSNSSSGNNSDSMSNTSSIGVTANAVVAASDQNNHNNSNCNITTKLLADNESNQQHHLQHHHQQQHHKINGGIAMKQKNIAIISPNSHKNFNNNKHSHHHHHHHGNNNKSPTVLRKHHEHHHSSDISKFNRSNRKSKNCAIFYFKHLDTDNETNYSNSNCGDDGHDDCHGVACVGGGGGGSSGLVGNDHHCREDFCNVGGSDVDDNDVGGLGNDNIIGGLLSSSAASSSHTSDVSTRFELKLLIIYSQSSVKT